LKEAMTRWIVGDQKTAHAVRSRTEEQVEFGSPDTLDSALSHEKAVALVAADDATLVVVVEKKSAFTVAPGVTRWEHPEAVSYAATGMLGLVDEPVYEEEKPKSWWRKLLGRTA
jgi:hypothetical protein